MQETTGLQALQLALGLEQQAEQKIWPFS